MKEKYYVVAKSIARWKLDNPFENRLGYMADKSEFWKRIYVLYYQVFDKKYYVSGINICNKTIRKYKQEDKDIEDIPESYLRRDMIYSLHRFGVSFSEYYIYKFYNKSFLCRQKINNLKIQYGYCELVNSNSVRELFENKYKTYQVFRKFFKRDLICITSICDLPQVEAFLLKHKDFILKPLKGVCGRGVRVYRNFKEPLSAFLHEQLKSGEFVIEELISQACPLATLHKSSINTVRIATFRTKTGVHIYGAALRMGKANSVVDNAGSGGIFCHINHKYGFIDTNAKDYMNNEYVFHPDSKVRFVGFEIPEWEKLVAMVKEMALVVQGATIISWDMAYSNTGWEMVEANDVGEPNLLQFGEEGNKKLISKYISDYFEAN